MMAFVGDRSCLRCRNYPSHVLVPCQHGACYLHLSGVLEGPPRKHAVCVVCNQVVHALQGCMPAIPAHAPSTGLSVQSNMHHLGYSSQGFTSPIASVQSLSGASLMHRPLGHCGSSASSERSLATPTSYSSHGLPNAKVRTSPDLQLGQMTLEDPFVDTNDYTLPTGGPPKARTLVDLIKSGAFEDPSMPPFEEMRSVKTTSPSSHVTTPPLIQLWGSHMVEPFAEPPFLQSALNGILPRVDKALQFQPFVLPANDVPVPEGGVVAIKNIPYTSTKAEIIAAIGRNSRIAAQPAGSPFYAIHIIMERSTGKTMDCFVELESKNEAKGIVYAYRSRCDRGRAPRVGERHVVIEMSSYEDLMEQLFPKARCVTWDGGVPSTYAPKEAFNSGFMGFVTVEECALLVKHAESPQRSPFVARALNRVFEALISILWRYPWHATTLITLGERALLFRTTIGLLRVLLRAVATAVSPSNLTQSLLQELLAAALGVPFSHRQKLEIADLACGAGFAPLVGSVGFTPLPRTLGIAWPFDALDVLPGVGLSVVELYASFLRAGCPATRRTMAGPFGGLQHMIQYPLQRGASDTRGVSLRAAAAAEWDAMARALEAVLPSAEDEERAHALVRDFSPSPLLEERAGATVPKISGVLQREEIDG